MSTLFNNILIPVDFSENTDVAVQKAIELAHPVNSTIHLFHVSNPTVWLAGSGLHGLFSYQPLLNDWYSGEVEAKIQPYKTRLQESLPQAEIIIHMVTGGGVQQHIIEAADSLSIKLIIVGKRKSHKWLPFLNTINSSVIARKTNVAVLTVRPGTSNIIKSIVLPVGSFIPERKLELLELLTHKQKPVVHLIANNTKEQPLSKTGAILDTFRTLRHRLNYTVKYELLKDKNFARGILNYAENVMADLILVNPEETKVNMVYRRDINDLIAPPSKLIVLTAEPFHH